MKFFVCFTENTKLKKQFQRGNKENKENNCTKGFPFQSEPGNFRRPLTALSLATKTKSCCEINVNLTLKCFFLLHLKRKTLLTYFLFMFHAMNSMYSTRESHIFELPSGARG